MGIQSTHEAVSACPGSGSRPHSCPSTGRLESWVLALSIAGYPLVAGLSQLTGTDNRLLSIAMRAALLALSLLLLVKFPFVRLSRKNILFWSAWWFFWAAYVLRLAGDTVLAPTELPLASSEYWLFAIGTCLLPAIAVSRGNAVGATEHAFTKTHWMLVFAAALNLIVLFAQRAIGDVDTLRAETEVLNPIALGHMGVSILLMSLCRLNEGGREHRSGHFAIYASCAIAAFTIFISASKGPLISLTCALLMYAISRPNRFFSRYLLAAIFAVPLVIAVNFDTIQNSFLVARIADGIFSDSARIELLSGAATLIANSPFVGAGIEPLASYPHNLVVESFLAFGLLTGIPFCVLIFTALTRSVALARRRNSLWGALLFVQYGVAAMFSGSLYGSYVFWVLMVWAISQPIPPSNILTKLPTSPTK